MGSLDDAIREHHETLRLKPDFAEGNANFGRTLLAAGRREEAIAYFERALQLKPVLSAVRGHYAAALAALGRTGEAAAFDDLREGVDGEKSVHDHLVQTTTWGGAGSTRRGNIIAVSARIFPNYGGLSHSARRPVYAPGHPAPHVGDR